MKSKAAIKPKPKRKRSFKQVVDSRQLVSLMQLASQMADDLRDFGSENADWYAEQLDQWSSTIKA